MHAVPCNTTNTSIQLRSIKKKIEMFFNSVYPQTSCILLPQSCPVSTVTIQLAIASTEKAQIFVTQRMNPSLGWPLTLENKPQSLWEGLSSITGEIVVEKEPEMLRSDYLTSCQHQEGKCLRAVICSQNILGQEKIGKRSALNQGRAGKKSLVVILLFRWTMAKTSSTLLKSLLLVVYNKVTKYIIPSMTPPPRMHHRTRN